MRKLQILGAALVAMFAFGVVTAGSASAATFLLAEWLLNGNPVSGALSVEITGELLLTDKGVGAMVLCSGTFVGTVEAESKDLISEVLDLSGKTVSTANPLLCTSQALCETSNNPHLLPLNLPWETEAELMEDTGSFLVDLLLHTGSTVGWLLTECLVLGGLVSEEDECTAAEGIAELTLEGTTLLGTFNPALNTLSGVPFANCTKGGTGTGEVEGSGPFVPDTTEELTASSETTVA